MKSIYAIIIWLLLSITAAAVPPRITDLRILEITHTTATLAWTVPLSSNPLIENDIRMNTGPVSALNWTSSRQIEDEPAPDVPGTTQTMKISGLVPKTQYYFAIKVRDQSGWSLLSNVATDTTRWPKDRVSFGWNANKETNLAGYYLYYGPGSGIYTNKIRLGLETNTVVSNLVYGVTYYFALTAFNNTDLESYFAKEIDFTPAPEGFLAPRLIWNSPINLTYGMRLTSRELNAQAVFTDANGMTSTVLGRYEYTPPPFALLNAGGHKLSVTFIPNDTSRYISVYMEKIANVGQAMLTARVDSITKVYGEPIPPLIVSYEGFVNGENSEVLSELPVFSVDAWEFSNVGEYPIRAGGWRYFPEGDMWVYGGMGIASNYAILPIDGTLTVTPAPLTLVADSKWKYQWTENPPLMYWASGFVNGDGSYSFYPPITLTTTAGINSPPGYYPILFGETANPNYAIEYIPGTLRVIELEAPLITVTPANASVLIGAAAPFTAMYLDTNGVSSDITDRAQWHSSAPHIASLSSNVVTGVTAGSTIITAALGGTRGAAAVNVISGEPPEMARTEAPLVIKSIVVLGKQTQLTMSGPSGRAYTLERSIDLKNWTPIHSSVIHTEADFYYIDEVLHPECGFYRLAREF